MRPITKLMKLTTFALAATAMTASTGASAADFNLKLGPVKSDQGSAKIREAAARAEVTSWSWGASQGREIKKITTELYVEQRVGPSAPPATPATSSDIRPGAADYDGDDRADRNVKSPRDSASGQASGKRMHRPPIVRGSVTLAGNFPSCTVGAAYEDAVLQVADARYRFEDVVITACGPSGGGVGTPAQALTYSYLKRKLN